MIFAAWLFRHRHLDVPGCQCRNDVCFPEVFFVFQAQNFLQFLACHGPGEGGEQACNFPGNRPGNCPGNCRCEEGQGDAVLVLGLPFWW